MRTTADSVGRVVVRAPNWVGDAVMAEPALRQLRRVFKNAHLAIIARPWLAGLYEGEDLADEIIDTDVRGIGSFVGECRRLGKRQFDMAVLLQNAFSAALFARVSGIRRVAGYPTDGRRLLLDPVIPFDRNLKTRHQVFYYLRIASFLESVLTSCNGTENPNDSVCEGTTPRLRATTEAMDRAGQLLAEAGVETGSGAGQEPLLILNPGATNSRAKRWLPERFAEIADLLATTIGFRAAIIGTPSDLEVAQTVARKMRTRAAMLAGKTGISDLKGLLARASLLISNDTGAAHMAAALGIPTVAVFGPTEHFATHPYSSRATVVRHPVECSPCMLRDCPIDHRCMVGVKVDDVGQAVGQLLGLKIAPTGAKSLLHQ